MIRKLLIIVVFLMAIPGCIMIWLVTTESGLQWTHERIQQYIPESVSIGRIEGRLIGPITITDFHYHDSSADVISKRATLDWQPLSLIYATININQFHVSNVNILIKQKESSDSNSKIETFSLPIKFKLGNIQLNNISIDHQDNKQVIDYISLNATSSYNQLRIKKLRIKSGQSDLTAQGFVKLDKALHHNLNIKWSTLTGDQLYFEGHGNIRGNLETLYVQHELDKPQKIILNAQVNQPINKLEWNSKIYASDFDASNIKADWPGIPLTFTLNASGDLENANYNLNIKDSTNSKTPIIGAMNLNGLIALRDDIINVSIKSRHSSVQNIHSDFSVKADIHASSAIIKSLDISSLEGNSRITGNISWEEKVTWDIDINSNGVNPSIVNAALPSKLNTSLKISGGISNGRIKSKFNNIRMSGILNKQNIILTGNMRLEDTSLYIDNTKIIAGKSALNLHGMINEKVNLKWNMKSEELSQLHPDLKGRLIANGTVKGTRDKPAIQSIIDANMLSYSQYTTSKLHAEASLDFADYSKTDVKLKASSIKINNELINNLTINLNPHRLITNIESEKFNALFEFDGKLDPHSITGQLKTANINTKDAGQWSLVKPADLVIDRTNIDNVIIHLDNTCWINTSNASACIKMKRQMNNLNGSILANDINLSLLDKKLPVDLQLQGKAKLSADFNLIDNQSMNAAITVQLKSGSIQQVVSKRQTNQWKYKDGYIKLDIDSNGLKASSSIDIDNNDSFRAKLDMPGFNPFTYQSASQLVNGHIELQMSNPDIIEATIPEPVDLEGKMLLNLQLSGYTARPLITGNININNGRLHIPRLGLNIEDIELKSQNRTDNSIHYSLTAQSGDGKLKITGFNQFNIEQGFPGEMRIVGNDIEVSNIPEAKVLASPDLTVRINKHSIEVNGNIHVPYAKLQPKDISSAENISSDVVIVGEDHANNKPWVVTSNIRLSLGDRVNFYGFGFEGRFGGEVLLQDQPGQSTTATGTLTIPEGRYRAYGQRLDVDYGKIIYTGSPVDNPGLDIRAVRKINEVTAGLTIRGNLKKPRIELFSSPAMGQSDILAYLILGGPIENASGEEGATMARAALALGLTGGDQLARRIGDRFGFDEMRVETSNNGDQASLVIGRYLSPKLYVSYGVGLVEALNSVRLRYQISSKWQLKVESGESHGADFLYTIER